MTMSEWTSVADRSAVEPEAPLGVIVNGTEIGVYDVGGALYAIENICPHANARLSEGFAEGCEIECPLHSAIFDVTTGTHLRGEPCRDVKTFPVRIVEGRIEIQG
jgi:3-phenylpropionate/trans-cinnamate dioxygenase ferredoxin component